MTATKRWNNDSKSVAHIETPTDQATLAIWWRNGTGLRWNVAHDAEKLQLQMALRAGRVTYAAFKRRGHFIIEVRAV